MATLKVQPREATSAAKSLRKQGLVPMALVDDQKQTKLVQAPLVDVKRALSQAHGAGMVEIEIEGDGGSRNAIVKSYDQEAITHKLLSVTLMQVSLDEEITTDVPVVSQGTPEAVESGEAMLNTPGSSIKIKGRVKNIPDQIEVDISGLGVGDHINAGDIKLPDGMTLISSPDSTLFSVQVAKEVSLEETPAPVEETEPPSDTE